MKRQGNTGVWLFVKELPDNKVVAKSEWGTKYTFNKKEWESLQVIP